MIIHKTIEQRIEDLEKRIELLEGGPINSIAHPKIKKSSAKEFLMTKEVNSEVLKVLALAYYLEYMEGIQSFNAADIETVFRLAKEKIPKNINDAVNKNIAKGFVMEASEKKDSKKAWVLTSTGEKYVEDNLKK